MHHDIQPPPASTFLVWNKKIEQLEKEHDEIREQHNALPWYAMSARNLLIQRLMDNRSEYIVLQMKYSFWKGYKEGKPYTKMFGEQHDNSEFNC